MNIRNVNWPIWAGFLLSIIAFLTYPFVFVWFPLTRDFPWANILLFALAALLVVAGIRRAFASDRPRPRRSKIVGLVLGVLSAGVLGLFIFAVFIGSRFLPASSQHPQVGAKAPDFTLSDSEGKSVALAELLSAPINGKPPKGVLLIFYRGYW